MTKKGKQTKLERSKSVIESSGSSGQSEMRRTKSMVDIPYANQSHDEFVREFSFLFNGVPKAEIDSAIEQGHYKQYKKLLKDHNTTFLQIPENSSSPLHRAVVCSNKNIDEVEETIIAVLQSGIDINHIDEKGNTPLMHMLSKMSDTQKKRIENPIDIICFLVEHGADLELENHAGETAWDLINALVTKKFIDKKQINNIEEAAKSLQAEAKKELSQYIQNDVEKVSIYGSRAEIQLKGDKEEFKISEFLNSDFCQNNGISGFSTLHGNGKSGMHGVVSSEGIRHYVVTDGSYEMALNWYVEGKECSIKININADGSVKLTDRNGVTDEEIAKNKDVKIGNLSLFDALVEEKWKENEISETLRSNSVGTGASETYTSTYDFGEIGRTEENILNTSVGEFAPPLTSTPLGNTPSSNPGGISPIPYQDRSKTAPFTPTRAVPQSNSMSGNSDGYTNTFNNSFGSYPTLTTFGPEATNAPTESQQQHVGHQKNGNEGLHNGSRSGSESDAGYSSDDQFRPTLTPIDSTHRGQSSGANAEDISTFNGKTSSPSFDEQSSGYSPDDSGLGSDNSSRSSSPIFDGQPEMNHEQSKEKSSVGTTGSSAKKTPSPPQSRNSPSLSEPALSPENPLLERIKNAGKSLKPVGIDGREESRKRSMDGQSQADQSQSSIPSGGSDSGFSSPTHTRFQLNPEQLKKNLKNIGQGDSTLLEEALKEIRDRFQQENHGLKKTNPFDQEGELFDENLDDIGAKLDHQKYNKFAEALEDRQLFDESDAVDSILIKRLPSDKAYSRKFDQDSLKFKSENYDISSPLDGNEQETAKSKNATAMNELEEMLIKPNRGLKKSIQPEGAEKNIPSVNSHNPFLELIDKEKPIHKLLKSIVESGTISEDSSLHKLLEKDSAQLKVGVIEGKKEDNATKSSNSCDQNRIALGNKSTELSKETKQNWAERVKEQQKTRDLEASRV
jgi:hypothetical protein